MRIGVAILLLAAACSLTTPRSSERTAAPPPATSSATSPVATAGPSAPPAGPRLLVLGTYHMTSNGSDLLQVKAPDVTTPARQRELDELVAVLGRFRPTKIALEKPLGDADTREHYRGYLAGDYQPTRNEVDQVGFRLARAMHHAEVYPVDWRNNFDFMPVAASAARHQQTVLLEAAIGEARSYTTELQQQMERPIVETLRFVNDVPRAAQLHQLYVRLLRIGKADDYAGPDLLAGWFERNLKITANLIRIVDSPDDRVVFLVGSGHLHLVRQFAAESGAFTLESASDYLDARR